MLTEDIRKRLEAETQDEDIVKLTGRLKDMLKKSRNDMSKHYPKWDRNARVYRGIRGKDEEDYQAQDANEPEKSVIPMSYAQVQTFVGFGFLLLTQNARFYEMQATGDEDFDFKELIEKGLSRDLRQNEWNAKLYQFLLDMARFTISPVKNWWTVDTQRVDVTIPESIIETEYGPVVAMAEQQVSEEMIKYEGNRIKNILPYRFLPDTRKPLVEWKKGQFVADEDEWHITNVKELERKGLAAGTKWIRPMDKKAFHDRGTGRLPQIEAMLGGKTDENDFMCSVVEGNVRLNPQEYKLGPDDYECLYTFRLVNDRLVSISKSGYLHDSFNYDMGQFSPDHEAKLTEGLSDVINALQDTVSWLYNSRIAAVRQSLDRHLVVNPQWVDIASLESRSPIIYLKKGSPNQDIRSLIHQLEIKDTTASHFNDADILMKTMQYVTGVNENAMGQFSGGRRSATENRAANAGAAQRMKMILSCAWDNALGPLGYKMMINQRQGISAETYTKIFGEDPKTAALFPRFAPSDPRVLVGNEDFFTFDATLTSEKGFLAQSMQEMLVAAMSNPEFVVATGMDIEKLFNEIQTLRGITNVQRFFRPVQAMGPGGPQAANNAPGAVPGQPAVPAPSAGQQGNA